MMRSYEVNGAPPGKRVLLVVALLAASAAFFVLSYCIINPVTYEIASLKAVGSMTGDSIGIARSMVIPLVALAAIVGLAWPHRTSAPQSARSHPVQRETFNYVAVVLTISSVAGLASVWGVASQLQRPAADTIATWGGRFGEVFPFVLFSIFAIGIGWSVSQFGQRRPIPNWCRRINPWASTLVWAAVGAATIFHTLEQYHFWNHFLLGYADFGLFTTELEHCLPHKVVGLARFAGTRMGFHCIPMFYLLVPLYALFRTPLFLMFVGPAALNLGAVPFYQLARDRTGVPAIGLIVALAYLALPSLSRLPYSDSYGFQSIFLTVPWLAFCFCFAARDRWRASHICLAGAMLCEETVCGVAFGWGAYLALFKGRRRDGAVIIVASLLYLLLCTAVVIPAFARSADYTRVMLFGDVTLAVVCQRLFRPRVFAYLIALGAPMWLGLTRSIKPLIVIIPSLFLVLLLQQSDYLNIKYWHHTSILVGLFFSAALGVTSPKTRRNRAKPINPEVAQSLPDANDDNGVAGGDRQARIQAENRNSGLFGRTLGLLVTILIFHQFLGLSPFTQSQRVYGAQPRLRESDPRLLMVDWVRGRFPADRLTVVATERMAAHFTDYRMVYPAARIRPGNVMTVPAVVILDRSDAWDEMVAKGQTGEFLDKAEQAGFVRIHEQGTVLILANGLALRPIPP